MRRLMKLYNEDRVIILPKKMERKKKDKLFHVLRGKKGREEVEKVAVEK